MQEKSLFAIHEFTRAVTQLVVDKDGIEGTPTPDIEAVLLALPPVWVVIEENPDWPQIMPLRRAVTATEALLTTLTVIEEEHEPGHRHRMGARVGRVDPVPPRRGQAVYR